MERAQLIKIGGALGVGAILFVVAQTLNTAPPPPAPQIIEAAPVAEEMQHEFVLVATASPTRGQRLAPEMLDWQQWPAEAVMPNFIVKDSRPQAIEELSNSVVRMDMFAGEPINEGKLVRPGDSGLMAALLAPGMRAVTTRVSVESAAGGFIMPGDRVDVILTTQIARDRTREVNQVTRQYTSSTIFEDVRVLAVNQRYSNTAEAPAANPTVSYATLEMAPEDAEMLEEAALSGTISLTLRGLQPNGPARSASKSARQDLPRDSTLVVYRDGKQTQTAIRGD